MRGFASFLRKEGLELTRTHRVTVFLLIYALFGIISPLLAKVMPEIFAKLAIGGVTISIPPPTYLDAYAQFFKNMTQMGLIVVLLIFAGTLSQELSIGTLILPLTKGLSRDAVIAGKFTSSFALYTVGFAASAAVTVYYTNVLFGVFAAPNLLFSLFCLWLFGAFLISLLLLTSCIAPGSYGGLLLCAGVLVLLMVAQAIPALQPLNPLELASKNTALLAGTATPGSLSTPILAALVLTAAQLFAAIAIFRKKTI